MLGQTMHVDLKIGKTLTIRDHLPKRKTYTATERKTITMIDVKEFREKGFLQEANRLFFHPLGLALEVIIHDDGTESLGGIWDYRDDEVGLFYDPDDLDPQKKYNVEQEGYRHAVPRLKALKMKAPERLTPFTVQKLLSAPFQKKKETYTSCGCCGGPEHSKYESCPDHPQ